MTWLLKLYPPRWRRRYGRELAQLVATRPFSIATAIDLVAGAIDAWIYPQSSTAAAESKGGRNMVLTVFIVSQLLAVTAILLGAAWLSERIN